MFERITEETFDEIFPLLESAFPVTELRTKEDQRTLLKEAAYVLYGVRKNGVFVHTGSAGCSKEPGIGGSAGISPQGTEELGCPFH